MCVYRQHFFYNQRIKSKIWKKKKEFEFPFCVEYTGTLCFLPVWLTDSYLLCVWEGELQARLLCLDVNILCELYLYMTRWCHNFPLHAFQNKPMQNLP